MDEKGWKLSAGQQRKNASQPQNPVRPLPDPIANPIANPAAHHGHGGRALERDSVPCAPSRKPSAAQPEHMLLKISSRRRHSFDV